MSPFSGSANLQPENVLISVFYMVILGEMDPEVVQLVISTRIWTWRPLIRFVIQKQAV